MIKLSVAIMGGARSGAAALSLQKKPVEVVWRKPRGRPRTHWRDYISLLAWESLGIPQEELEGVAGRRMPGFPYSV